MSAGIEQTSGKTTVVTTVSEEMSANTNSEAAAIKQATTNLGLVASATEEMTASVSEIAQNSEKPRDITGDVVTMTRSSQVNLSAGGVSMVCALEFMG